MYSPKPSPALALDARAPIASRLDEMLEHNTRNLARLSSLYITLKKKRDRLFGAYPEKEDGQAVNPAMPGALSVLHTQVTDLSNLLDRLEQLATELEGI